MIAQPLVSLHRPRNSRGTLFNLIEVLRLLALAVLPR